MSAWPAVLLLAVVALPFVVLAAAARGGRSRPVGGGGDGWRRLR